MKHILLLILILSLSFSLSLFADNDMPMNHPVRIQFTNGNVTEYVYSVSGEKLRTIYRTAVSNITVPMGTTHTLTQGETLSVDSTDYCFGGSLILRNGRLSRYLFDGGYCSFTLLPSIGNLQYATTFHYYQQDHLGNIREVINGNNGYLTSDRNKGIALTTNVS